MVGVTSGLTALRFCQNLMQIRKHTVAPLGHTRTVARIEPCCRLVRQQFAQFLALARYPNGMGLGDMQCSLKMYSIIHDRRFWRS